MGAHLTCSVSVPLVSLPWPWPSAGQSSRGGARTHTGRRARQAHAYVKCIYKRKKSCRYGRRCVGPVQRRQSTCARLNVHVIPQLSCGVCWNVATASSGENTCTLVDSGGGARGGEKPVIMSGKTWEAGLLVDFLCELKDQMFHKLLRTSCC